MSFWLRTSPCKCCGFNSRRASLPLQSLGSLRYASRKSVVKPKVSDISTFPTERIRNFAIIAHIDHGKSTLADRLLELTGTIEKYEEDESGEKVANKQVLDKLKVERERGITVKAQTASMFYERNGDTYLLNLLDTPGHVDFSAEVIRSLLACQGCLLLVDSSQGVQAQTLSVLNYAKERALPVIPILNKIDLPHSAPEEVEDQILSILLKENDADVPTILRISAKTGLNVDSVLDAIVDHIPPPKIDKSQGEGDLRALVFDSWFDTFRGVVSLVALLGGKLNKGDTIVSAYSGRKYEVNEIGFLHPEEVPLSTGLSTGQVGYITCNMKDSAESILGDTFHHLGKPVPMIQKLKAMKPMIYSGVYPMDASEFPKLEESVKRLTLNDRSVTVQKESSAALGLGFRLGFLGSLHNDVFRQRLEDEYNAEVIITRPFVPLKILSPDGTEKMIHSAAEFPDMFHRRTLKLQVLEPLIKATINVPDNYLGVVMEHLRANRCTTLDYSYLSSSNSTSLANANLLQIISTLPLSSIVTTFHSTLKSLTSGYASFDYEEAGWEVSDLGRLEILVNGKKVEELSSVCHKTEAEREGKRWTERMRKVVDRQQFEVVIQAAFLNKIVSKDRLAPMRKDVTAGLYGGHYERKLKHLNKQKEGKKRLKRIGNVDISAESFHKILSTRE